MVSRWCDDRWRCGRWCTTINTYVYVVYLDVGKIGFFDDSMVDTWVWVCGVVREQDYVGMKHWEGFGNW